MDEEWRPVRECPEHYEISSLGKLRRIKPYKGLYAGTILKPNSTKEGYLTYHLSIDGTQVSRYAHRLVADAFLGPIPPKMEVNHKDGITSRPHLENLEIVSRGENRAHSYRVLGIPPNGALGERNANARLTWDAVSAIRSDYKAGRANCAELARRYNVSISAVDRVVRKVTWARMPKPSPNRNDQLSSTAAKKPVTTP